MTRLTSLTPEQRRAKANLKTAVGAIEPDVFDDEQLHKLLDDILDELV